VGITGDGGANHGTFHETLNIAAAWELPLIVLVENNFLAISVPTSEVIATETVAERAAAYRIPGETVDGTDVTKVAEAFARAVDHARAERGPYLVEVVCHRFQGHYEGDSEQYRSTDERERIRREHDPIAVARRQLVRRQEADQAQLDRIDAEAKQEMKTLLEEVRGDPMPEPSEALRYVFVEDGNGD
jgi:pyruvate dehydrogenase E1 component alpha subunit